MALFDIRKKYANDTQTLLEDHLPFKEPIGLFENWMETVLKKKLPEPNAMYLATCTRDGIPSSRMVLLKSVDKDGFVFFTNYNSRKGKEMDENPNVSAVLYWEPLSRSVRIEGSVTKMSVEYSEKYFRSRPKGSQISAYVSAQSTVISGRSIIENEVQRVTEVFDGSEILHPHYWGGIRIIPKVVEFWQGQTNRLHDRIRFRKLAAGEVIDEIITHYGDDGWVYERLSP